MTLISFCFIAYLLTPEIAGSIDIVNQVRTAADTLVNSKQQAAATVANSIV